MKLNKKHQAPGSEVSYKLDTLDGQFCEASMRAEIAEEIVRTAETVELADDEEYGLLVNGRMMFPIKAFTFEEGELEKIPRHGAKRPARKSGRPTKAELLKEAGETMTNPEIHEAIVESKARKAAKAEQKAEKAENPEQAEQTGE